MIENIMTGESEKMKSKRLKTIFLEINLMKKGSQDSKKKVMSEVPA